MVIDLDRDSEIPLGVQLAWTLRARIGSGELAAGARLPGVRELAADAGVNVNTVRAVYARLETDGLIRAEHGRGTFVAEGVATDDRLAAATRRALAAAREAGLDPRDLAAALFATATPAITSPLAEDEPATRRRALREEIAMLEQALADERLARALRDTTPAATRPSGGRLLSEEELRALRDDLDERLRALRSPGPADGEAAPTAPSTRSATRPGVSWRPVFGA